MCHHGQRNPACTKCNTDYGQAGTACASAACPTCVGFEQGKRWGKCHSACDAVPAQWWLDVQMWPDSLTLEFKWDKEAGCAGGITVDAGSFATR